MVETVTLWGHALAALVFGMIALSQLRDATAALPRLTFLVALAATGLWALAVAGIGPSDVIARAAESMRNLAWLGFMFALVRRDRGVPQGTAIATVYGVVALVVMAGLGLIILETATASNEFAQVRTLLRMMVAVTALVLVHHLYWAVAPRARGGVIIVLLALAAMWGADLIAYAVIYVIDAPAPALVAARGALMVLLAPLFAIAVHRNGDWSLRLSRAVAWQSAWLIGGLIYVTMVIGFTGLIEAIGGPYARIAETAFVFGATTAAITLVSSPWLKAWAKVKLAKHFFRHRYDYRAEWARFTETLGKPEGAAPLEERVVKAVADLTDSPGGMLLIADGGALAPGAVWNWPADPSPPPAAPTGLADYLASTGRIVALDTIRAEQAEPDELRLVPQWMVDTVSAWVLVPLVHVDRLQGAILLSRPPVDRALDWEDLDLLRIAGRQVASYLAEAQAQSALAEAQRFDEFNRRFAFILHDIKNLVSQLTLTARNAERHADKPEFRADMVATLQDSAGRMNDLLARLSQHSISRPEPPRAIDALALAERVAAARRAQHPVAVVGRSIMAMADASRLETLLGHLLQNAIEATGGAEPVTIAVGADGSGEGARATFDVIDHGCGMSHAFIRDSLFKPFVSSKPGGFGIGAFEARQLAEAMGGSVSVFSREGEGTRFRVTLPLARAIAMEVAA